MQELNKKLKELEISYFCLEDDVRFTKHRMEKLRQEIEKDEAAFDKLKREFDKMIRKINDKKIELVKLEMNLPNLANQLKNKTEEIQNNHISKIKKLKLEDCYITTLSKETRTIVLLDDFVASKKDFLILKNYWRLKNNKKNISFIMTKNIKAIESIGRKPTMTELKQYAGECFALMLPYRLFPIIDAINEIDSYSKHWEVGDIHVFAKPYIIGGQTSSTRSEYSYEDGEYIQKIRYGDVSDFLLVGFIV